MKACSAILKSIDLLILRPEDKARESQCVTAVLKSGGPGREP